MNFDQVTKYVVIFYWLIQLLSNFYLCLMMSKGRKLHERFFNFTFIFGITIYFMQNFDQICTKVDFCLILHETSEQIYHQTMSEHLTFKMRPSNRPTHRRNFLLQASQRGYPWYFYLFSYLYKFISTTFSSKIIFYW
jgi:hypothetical protein